jgi:hypothetical protein
MSRPSLFEGILVALTAGVVAGPLVYVLRLILSAGLAWKAVIVVMAYAYIVYLLAQSGRTAGRITLAVLSLLALLASLVFEVHWSSAALIAMSLVWGIRAYAYSQSLVAALLHGGLCLFGLGAALWAYAHSGSLALASWSFFLTQAAFVLVPPRLARRTPATAEVAGARQSDGFVLAYQAAQKVLNRLHA